MRIAMMIIALSLTAIVGLQSCAVMVTGSLAQRSEASGGGALGIIVAFLFVLGAGFAMGLPRVSMVVFVVAAVAALLAAVGRGFTDMFFWGIVAAVLAVMSWLGSRELNKKRTPAAAADPQAP